VELNGKVDFAETQLEQSIIRHTASDFHNDRLTARMEKMSARIRELEDENAHLLSRLAAFNL